MNNENKEIMQFLTQEFGKINGRLDKMDGRLDKMDGRLDKMDDRLDKMDDRLDKIDSRLDSVESRLDVMEVRQNKMSEQLTELQIAQKRFELSTNKRFAKLQDGMDTVVEILRVNDLLPN